MGGACISALEDENLKRAEGPAAGGNRKNPYNIQHRVQNIKKTI
jgi:hypothetical protein